MGRLPKNLWAGYRQASAAWGLLVGILELCGAKTVTLASALALLVGVAARFTKLAAIQWFVLALASFAAVCVISVSLQKRRAVKNRYLPILAYKGLHSLGNWAFCVPLNVCSLSAIEVRNSQVAVANVARNVKACIDYTHDGGERIHLENAAWKNVNPPQSAPGSSIVSSLSLSADEAQNLIIVAQQHQSGKIYLLTEGGASWEDLQQGHWNIAVRITADGTEPLPLQGGFTIFPDNTGSGPHIGFDTPAFIVKRPWSLRNWKG
jgi:hypothetical protein